MTPTMRNRLSAVCLVVALVAMGLYLYLTLPKENIREYLAEVSRSFGAHA